MKQLHTICLKFNIKCIVLNSLIAVCYRVWGFYLLGYSTRVWDFGTVPKRRRLLICVWKDEEKAYQREWEVFQVIKEHRQQLYCEGQDTF